MSLPLADAKYKKSYIGGCGRHCGRSGASRSVTYLHRICDCGAARSEAPAGAPLDQAGGSAGSGSSSGADMASSTWPTGACGGRVSRRLVALSRCGGRMQVGEGCRKGPVRDGARHAVGPCPCGVRVGISSTRRIAPDLTRKTGWWARCRASDRPADDRSDVADVAIMLMASGQAGPPAAVPASLRHESLSDVPACAHGTEQGSMAGRATVKVLAGSGDRVGRDSRSDRGDVGRSQCRRAPPDPPAAPVVVSARPVCVERRGVRCTTGEMTVCAVPRDGAGRLSLPSGHRSDVHRRR